MIKGIHVLSTRPSLLRTGRFCPVQYEVASTVLSALLWRKHNGTIKLFTDTIGKSFYESLGLLDIWDDGVDTSVVENIPDEINQSIFWAACKLFALKAVNSPIAMIDTDLFIWKPLQDYIRCNVVVLHKEDLIDCYVSRGEIGVANGYTLDDDWDWTVLPCNTAFAYFSEQTFKDYYLTCALKFMKSNNSPNAAHASQMVFAEQRMLSMCAKQKDVVIDTIIDNPFSKENNTFTHVWGAKDIANHDEVQNRRLVNSILLHIKKLSLDHYKKVRNYSSDRYLSTLVNASRRKNIAE